MQIYLSVVIYRIQLVEDAFEWCNIIIRVNFAAHFVVDSNRSNICFGQVILCVIPNKNMMSYKSAHTFDNDREDESVVDIGKHSLEIRAVEVRPRKAIVHIVSEILDPILVCVLI